MKQTDLGLDLSTRRKRKQILLDKMAQVMPWSELLAFIAPHAPVARTGRPPFDLAMMLRIDCLQPWFGLSDLGAEEALFETGFYRDFAGTRCAIGAAPRTPPSSWPCLPCPISGWPERLFCRGLRHEGACKQPRGCASLEMPPHTATLGLNGRVSFITQGIFAYNRLSN